MRPANFILASSSNALSKDIAGVLQSERDAGALNVQDPSNWQKVLERLREEQPEVLMLELGPVLARLGDALREVKACAPRTRVAALHTGPDADSILTALRSGVHEFIHPPWSENLRPALERMLVNGVDEGGQRRGKVLGFLSAKGGCGATTIACHVADDLYRKTGRKVMLADMDVVSGMVGFAMKAKTTYSVLDAAQNITRLDESLWKALIVEYKPGFDVLPAPYTASQDHYIPKQDLVQLVRFMRTQHDWTVLDLGRSLNTMMSDLYEEMDQIMLVSVLEVTALHGLKTIVRLLTERGENLDKLQLVMNRTPKTMDMTTDELAKILGRPLYAMLPNDYPSLYRSYSSGTLLPPDNRLAQQFGALTSKITGIQTASTKKKFSLFG
jgi:pilus assembly protein CpaE